MIRAVLPILAAVAAVSAAEVPGLPPAAGRAVDFVKDIRPIFEAKCAKCHGAEKKKGGYRFDDRQTALHGGNEPRVPNRAFPR